jgi:glucose-1-phosphate adenylyltransferase
VDVFGVVLAGGEGKRLAPLTLDRAKPAVPFGGNYRLIDFALSNLVNAGLRRIVVLTQYKSHSLDRHIARTWQLSQLCGNYAHRGRRRCAAARAGSRLGRRDLPELQPAQRRAPGLRDASSAPTHIYRMDPAPNVPAAHAELAGVAVAALGAPHRPGGPVRRHRAARTGA